MRIRARKMAALLMAVTLMSVSGNPAVSTAVYAEDTLNVAEEGVPAETVPATEAPAVTQPVTEAPPATEAPPVTEAAPATEAPVTTEAPATEPQTTVQTEAPAPATEAAAQTTEAPSSETQATSESTEAKQTEPATQAATEAAQTETQAKETEKESEEPGKSREFSADAFKGKITVKLPKGKGISEKSVLVCEGSMYADNKGQQGKVNKQILGKQRVITGGRFCTIYLKDGDETIPIPEGTQITYKRSDGMDLKLQPLRQLKTHIFNVSGDSAKEISADISLNKDLAVTGFSFSAPKKLNTFGLIAEENRANDGAAVSRGSVISSIGEAAGYAAVAESVSGTVQDDSISNSADLLNSLAGCSVSLANATSGSDAAVVTVYTDSDGNVLTDAGDPQDPMRAVLGDGGQIDVSGRMVVLNYVVTNPGVGHISLPHYDIVSGGQTVDKDAVPEEGGRFVVTVTAIKNGTDSDFALQPYTGEVSISKHAVGTYLVPNGTISTSGRLVGAAYARSVNIAADRRLIKATVSMNTSAPEEAGTEAKDETEAESETETEAETEPGTENQTEAQEGVMLMAAAEDEDSVLSAAADEIPIAKPEEYTEGGLDKYLTDYTIDIAKSDNISSPNMIADAGLKLYNKNDLVYQYVTNAGETKTVRIPANTELHNWTSGTSAEPITSYFKVLGENGQLIGSTEYVIKETTVPADHAKAWDFTVTYQPKGSVNEGAVTITEVTLTCPTSDVNKSSISSEEKGKHIWIYDAPITAGSKYVNVAVNDSAVTDSTASGYYLSDVPIEIATVPAEGAEEKILASFSSIEGATPVDLSTLPMPSGDTPSEYVIREAAVAPGYIYDKNSFTKEGQQSVSFVSSVSFEIDKNGNISGLPTDKNLTFKQKKFSFTVEAVEADQTTVHVPDVKYSLKIGDIELVQADFLIDGQMPTASDCSGVTKDGKATITLTESGAKKLYPETGLSDSTKPSSITLQWLSDVPVGYQYSSDTDLTVTIETTQTTQDVQAKMAPWTFTVDARFENASSGAFVSGVPFTLKTESTPLGTDDYQMNNTPGTNSTLDGAATIKLTASGRDKVKAAGTKSLTLTWGNAPSGYTYVTKPDGVVINNGAIAQPEVRAVLNPWTFYVVARETTANISGAEFILQLSSGAILNSGTDFRPVTLTTTSGNVAIILTQTGAEAVRGMAQGGHLTVKAQSAPAGYNIKGGAFTANVTENGQTVIIPLEKVPEGKKGTLTVTKQTLIESTSSGKFFYVPELEGRTYYVSLFTDAGLQNRVAVQPVQVPFSAWSSSGSSTYPAARFENLNQGQYYYLAETDANGNVITPDGVSQIEFAANGNVGLQGSGQGTGAMLPVADTANVGNVILNNIYPSDANSMVSATFQIQVNVVDEHNKPLPSALTAEFTIRGGNGTHLSKSRTVQLSNESTKTRKDVPYRWDASKTGNKLNVAAELISLKDASGTNVMKNYDLVDAANKYRVLAKGTAIQNYTRRRYYQPLEAGKYNETTLVYTLKRVQTEKEVAELKLTKAVTYKKTPIRVNGTYYIGIFEDAAHTKILYKKAMALSNASSMTSTLKINLYKLAAPHTITLYFAEVDKNGNVVTSGKKSGYDISLNKTQVTLSPTNADESVILTNDVRVGSVAAANLTNPSSGFAGDASALAEAQALSNDETVKSKPTGDDTPFEPFALAAGISAAIIFLLLALLAARKKLWVK